MLALSKVPSGYGVLRVHLRYNGGPPSQVAANPLVKVVSHGSQKLESLFWRAPALVRLLGASCPGRGAVGHPLLGAPLVPQVVHNKLLQSPQFSGIRRYESSPPVAAMTTAVRAS